MKTFDEKGRIFGKMNIIDLIVVVALVAVIGAVGWHFLGDKVSDAVASEESAPSITYEVTCYGIDPKVAEYATTQMDTQLMSQGDLQPAYLRTCTVSPATVVNPDGKRVTDESLSDIVFTIEANIPMVANAYAIGTQELRTGKFHIVKTVTLEIDGTITAMDVEDGNE